MSGKDPLARLATKGMREAPMDDDSVLTYAIVHGYQLQRGVPAAEAQARFVDAHMSTRTVLSLDPRRKLPYVTRSEASVLLQYMNRNADLSTPDIRRWA